jgi:hypothetical protein
VNDTVLGEDGRSPLRDVVIELECRVGKRPPIETGADSETTVLEKSCNGRNVGEILRLPATGNDVVWKWCIGKIVVRLIRKRGEE